MLEALGILNEVGNLNRKPSRKPWQLLFVFRSGNEGSYADASLRVGYAIVSDRQTKCSWYIEDESLKV